MFPLVKAVLIAAIGVGVMYLALSRMVLADLRRDQVSEDPITRAYATRYAAVAQLAAIAYCTVTLVGVVASMRAETMAGALGTTLFVGVVFGGPVWAWQTWRRVQIYRE